MRRAKSDVEALLGQLSPGTHAYMWVYYEHAYEWRENSASEVRIAAPRWRLSRIEAVGDGAYRHAPVCSKALGLREVTPSITAFPAYANTLAGSLGLELDEGFVPAHAARWFDVSREQLEHQLHWTPAMAPSYGPLILACRIYCSHLMPRRSRCESYAGWNGPGRSSTTAGTASQHG